MTKKSVLEAGKLLHEAINGDRAAQGAVKSLVLGGTSRYIHENLSTSDLVRAFTGGIQADVLRQYAEAPKNWTDFAMRTTLPDFRPEYVREFYFDDTVNLPDNGGITTAPGSLPNIPEQTEYPSFGYTQSANAVKLRKNGARFPFGWEDVVNDRWGFIRSIPGEMVKLASNTEHTEATRLLASPTGPNANTFSAANGNINSRAGALFNKEYPLTLDSLALAKKDVRARKLNGNYVTVPRFRLVVPTALQDQAEAILGITDMEVARADGSRKLRIAPANSDVSLTVNDWLTRIDTSATAATTWYLVPDGGTDGTRDALAVAFLQGYETPDLRIGGSNAGQYLGGGDVSPLEGSLVDDTIEFRVRHTVAGGFLAGHALLASKGNETATTVPDQYTV